MAAAAAGPTLPVVVGPDNIIGIVQNMLAEIAVLQANLATSKDTIDRYVVENDALKAHRDRKTLDSLPFGSSTWQLTPSLLCRQKQKT